MRTEYIRFAFDYKDDTPGGIWLTASEFDALRLENLRDEICLIDGTITKVKSAEHVSIRFKKKSGILSKSTNRIMERPDIKYFELKNGPRTVFVTVPWENGLGTPPVNVHQRSIYKDGVLTIEIGRNIVNEFSREEQEAKEDILITKCDRIPEIPEF